MMISLIIPVYNLEGYLAQCLNSVLACGDPGLEIICVNDGSTDASGRILEEFQKRDKRIRVIHQENRGVSAARNAGLEVAGGDLIGFLDGDDVIHPQYISVLSGMLASGDGDMAVCDYRKIGQEEDVNWETACTDTVRILDAEASMRNHTVKCFAWGRLYKRELLKGLAFRENMALGEDRAFHLDLISSKPDVRVLWTQRQLYGYRQRKDSVVAGTGKRQWMGLAQDILNSCKEKLDSPGKAWYLTESFKLACSVRAFCRCDPQLGPETERLVSLCLQEMQKTTGLPVARRIGYRFIGKWPWIYRVLVWMKEKSAGSG